MISNRLKYIRTIKEINKKRYYRGIKYPEIPVSTNDLYAITTAGDRLDLLAMQFFNDLKLWWIIPTANKDIMRRDSYAVTAGLEIRIPTNINSILRDFEEINKF